jgi:hypothetical protein
MAGVEVSGVSLELATLGLRSGGFEVMLACLVAVACTPLPPTNSIGIPPIPSGEARIWFYRGDEPYAGRGTRPSPQMASTSARLSWAVLSIATFLPGITM